MSHFSLLTPPLIEPITLADVKTHARIDHDDEDDLLNALIVAARQWAENFTRRAFITQTWHLALDDAPKKSALTLPCAPLQSVTSVKIYADDDTAQLWNAQNYFTDTIAHPGRLVLRNGATWPSPTRPANGLIITYVVGYGDTAESVPQVIKTALRQLVAHWFEHRGDAATAPSTRGGQLIMPMASVPLVIQSLLLPYRIHGAGV